MVQDASLSAFPLIKAECDEDDDSDYHRRQGGCSRPGVQAAAETRARDEEGQPGGQKPTADEVERSYLTPEREMSYLGMTLGRKVAHEECEGCRAPESTLKPLVRKGSALLRWQISPAKIQYPHRTDASRYGGYASSKRR